MLRDIISLSSINKLSENRLLEKLTAFLLPIILLSASRSSAVPALVNAVVFIILVYRLEIPFKTLFSFMKGISLFVIMGAVPIALDRGLDEAAILAARSLSSTMSIFVFSTTTPMEQVLYAVQKSSHLKEVAELARTILRFLILVEDEFKRIKKAMESRLGFLGFRNGFRSTAKILAVLLINLLKRWDEIEDSLKSRGYRGELHFIKREDKYSNKILALGILYNLFLIVMIIYMEKG